MTAVLTAVGVGPGDPDLITLKAARRIEDADVIAYFSGTHGTSIARRIAAPLFGQDVIEELLPYPVTTGAVTDYYSVIENFYDDAAERILRHLEAGRSVVVLAAGDPLFFGSWMYLHERLEGRFPIEVVPGVTSISGATGALADVPGFHGLTFHEDVLTVLPGTLPVPELAWRLAHTDAAAIMKLGRTWPSVKEALRQAGLLERAHVIERATWKEQSVRPAAEVDEVPYFSIVIVAGLDRRADDAGRTTVAAPAQVESTQKAGTVHVVGLGPAGDAWLTPDAASVLASVSAAYGYAPYVAKVPPRPGLTLNPSGNTVEVDRARDALEAALGGTDVAVVSGGDAGVFGMAAAVFEAAQDERFGDVEVEVHPGVTAAQAVAARAGAPLGADFAVMSLSDRLKPWEVVVDRLVHISRADLVLAIYNPRSRSRPHQLGDALEVLRAERSPETVVVVGRHVGRAEETLEVTTLGELDPESIDMGCCLIIGASSTRVGPHGVWTPRFVRP